MDETLDRVVRACNCLTLETDVHSDPINLVYVWHQGVAGMAMSLGMCG